MIITTAEVTSADFEEVELYIDFEIGKVLMGDEGDEWGLATMNHFLDRQWPGNA